MNKTSGSMKKYELGYSVIFFVGTEKNYKKNKYVIEKLQDITSKQYIFTEKLPNVA
jgi:hypothetical protein